MANVSKLLEKYIEDYISLSQKDISQSAKSREWFLERIKHEIDKNNQQPALYSPEPFLNFGSYFKGTKVSDVDEYDVLVILDSLSGELYEHDTKIGGGLGSANPNFKYFGRKYFKDDNTGTSPYKLLRWLEGIVGQVVSSYSGASPTRNNQSVTARLENNDINIDLVPAGIFVSTTEPDKIL